MATTSPILQMVTTLQTIIMLKRNINILSPFDWWYGLIYFFLTLEDFFVRVKFVMTRWILTLKNNRFLLFNEFPVQQRRRFMPSVWLDYEAKYWGWHQKVIDIMRISLFFVATVFFLFSLSPTKDKLIGTFNHETDYSHLPNNISSPRPKRQN